MEDFLAKAVEKSKGGLNGDINQSFLYALLSIAQELRLIRQQLGGLRIAYERLSEDK